MTTLAFFAQNRTTVTIPTEQYYNGDYKNFPMYAVSPTKALPFKNLCGLLKLHLKKEGITISSITVTAAEFITGTYTVTTDNDGIPTITHQAGGLGGHATRLRCNPGVNIGGDGADFYIYLPEGQYHNLTIKMLATDGSDYKVKTTGNNVVPIQRSKYTTINFNITENFEPNDPELPEGFSVSETTSVYFAKGNLQYRASENKWRFSAHQWDFVGGTNRQGASTQGNVSQDGVYCTNNFVSSTYTSRIDLFGWGTGKAPASTLTSDNNSYASFTDWGNNVIWYSDELFSCQPNDCRTLTRSEWDYVFNSRARHSELYGYATVNGVQGVVLLPYAWYDNNPPSDITFHPANTGTNIYNDAQWHSLELKGAAFLPLAGARWADNANGGYHCFVNSVGTHGYYWSSTPSSEHSSQTGEVEAYNLYIDGTTLNTQNLNGRHAGMSVRLVKDITPSSKRR